MKRKSPTLDDRQFAFAAACVVAAVLIHVGHLPASSTLLIAAIVLAASIVRARGRAAAPMWIKLPLIALLPALVILHYGNIFGREPGAAFACGMLALKLLETTTRRDARAIVCFASFVLMSALLFDTSLALTALLFAIAVLLLATLRELEPRAAMAPTPPLRDALRSNLRQSAFALAAAIPLALCAFVFFPRLDSPLWRIPGDDIGRTGLSDSMTPGSIQNLLADDTPAFRVTFDDVPPPHRKMYWRGPVLTDFDGRTWKRHNTRPLAAGSQALQAGKDRFSYEVTLEANDKPWLFALDAPLDAPADARRASDLSIVRGRPVSELLRYRVQSVLDYRLDAAEPAAALHSALALPATFNPRSVELAQGWRRELVSDDAVIARALKLFHDEFTYSLAAPALGRDSVDDFLFGTRQGFCEHYSSAFVFLMRAAGIPARVVTGYHGGFFSTYGNYLLVRQSDAHAWAEVWLAGKGWVRVDPTAAISPQRIELGAMEAAGASSRWYQSDWIRTLRNQLDLVNRGWNSVIVQFNSLRQQSLLAPLGIEKADYMTLTWALIVTSGSLLLFVALWSMRTPRRVVDPLDVAYAALCTKLARNGPGRAHAEGPVDYSRRAQPAAQPLLQDYVKLRYATATPDAEAVAAFTRAVRRWRPQA